MKAIYLIKKRGINGKTAIFPAFFRLAPLFAPILALATAFGGETLKPLALFHIGSEGALAAESRGIATVDGLSRGDSGVFRRPPGASRRPSVRSSIVNILPGGLEATPGDYFLAMEPQIPGDYLAGTFAYGGAAKSLIHRAGVGWGIENLSGKFVPLLIAKDFELRLEPAYNILWERRTPTGVPGDRVFIDLQLSIPTHSSIEWGTETARRNQSFEGMFAANSPNVRPESVFRWLATGSSPQVYGESLAGFPPRLEGRPTAGIRPSGFIAPAPDRPSLVVATADGKLAALAADGGQIWTSTGRAPMVADAKGRIFAITADGGKIALVNPLDGAIVPLAEKPRFAPLGNAAMAAFSTSAGDFLMLIIPEQDVIACYAIHQ